MMRGYRDVTSWFVMLKGYRGEGGSDTGEVGEKSIFGETRSTSSFALGTHKP